MSTVAAGRGEGDYAEAGRLFEETRTLYRALNLRGGEAWTLNGLANVLRDQGEFAAALAYVEQALAIYRERHDFSGVGWTLYEKGDVLLRSGDREAAKATLQEALALLNLYGLNLYGERKIIERAAQLLERTARA